MVGGKYILSRCTRKLGTCVTLTLCTSLSVPDYTNKQLSVSVLVNCALV